MRLIDADALHRKVLGMTDADFIDFADMLKLIDSMPSIEAEPVRHGEWQIRQFSKEQNVSGDYPLTLMRCSLCHGILEFMTDSNRVTDGWDYCPNCGARMEKNDEKN